MAKEKEQPEVYGSTTEIHVKEANIVEGVEEAKGYAVEIKVKEPEKTFIFGQQKDQLEELYKEIGKILHPNPQ